ncbi:hypothetical protein [Pseudoponticoccus marisrubri]|uniref:Uncharacterized protein n=1 Tax=Pseudoponticoccus marisrubri TaxID=1685382 RepID=A0A0W7WIS0_9RHOB|nr:hypothetical protein [Pseudoponticoccus marisrubri]KUF10376.1 hypothetical protein AVJ23_13330 [Pseudoponticoccus marisrubri]
MEAPTPLLRGLLMICVAFFACMGAAHFFGLKIPVLFVYWDPPFYAYQDKIIAFTLVTYMALFFGAARHRVMVPYALVSIWATVIGLALVNLSDALAQVLNGGGTLAYWLITAAFGGLAAILTLIWVRDAKAR